MFFNHKSFAQNNQNFNKKISKSKIISKDTLTDSMLKLQQQSISKLNYQNSLLKSALEQQLFKVDKLIKQTESVSFNYKKDILLPFPASILSGLIFWFIISYLPERRRHNKIRRKIDLDLYHISNQLLSFYYTAIQPNPNIKTQLQKKLESNSLTLEDIELGLQNKCWNEKYLYDSNVNQSMIIIGKQLNDTCKKIYNTIERVFVFSNYLNSEEIILLERISKYIQFYAQRSLEENPIITIGNKKLADGNITLSDSKFDMYELYQLYNNLKSIVFNSSHVKKQTTLEAIPFYYYKGQYKKCKQEIKNAYKLKSDFKEFLAIYSIKCEYALNNKDLAHTILDNILSKKQYLLIWRDLLQGLEDDSKAMELVSKYYSSEDVQELQKVIAKENELEEYLYNELLKLKTYFWNKRQNPNPY